MISQQQLATPTGTRRIGMACILGALSAFGPLTIDMYLPALPRLAENLHASASLAQLSITGCLLGLAFGQLVSGPMSDAFGRRRPLLIGLVIYIIASTLCFVTSSIWVFLGLRLLQGLAGSTGIVISRAIVRDYFEGNQLIRFFTLLMLVNGVAPIVAPVLGGQLLRVTSWHGVFLVLAVVSFFMLLSVWFGLPESLPPHRRSAGGVQKTLVTMARLCRDRGFMGYTFSQGLIRSAMFAYISGSPFVLEHIFGLSQQMFSFVFAMNGLGIVLTSQASAPLAIRYGAKRILAIGLVISAASSIVLLTMISAHAELAAILPPLFVVIACVGGIGNVSTSLGMQTQEKAAGSASAVIGLFQMIGGAIAAPLVGIGGGHSALPMGLIIAICDIGAIVCFVTMVLRAAHRGPQTSVSEV